MRGRVVRWHAACCRASRGCTPHPHPTFPGPAAWRPPWIIRKAEPAHQIPQTKFCCSHGQIRWRQLKQQNVKHHAPTCLNILRHHNCAQKRCTKIRKWHSSCQWQRQLIGYQRPWVPSQTLNLWPQAALMESERSAFTDFGQHAMRSNYTWGFIQWLT